VEISKYYDINKRNHGEIRMAQEGMLKKTDIISIRVDSKLSELLHNKSSEQKISLNTLINHLLEKQLSWNEITNEIGWVSMFRATFREIMDMISKEKAIKIGKTTGKTDLRNSLNYFYGRIDLESILDLLKKRFQNMNIQSRRISQNGKEKIIVHHDLGKSWPYLVVSELNELLNEVGYRVINEEYNKQGFSFEIISVEAI